MKRLEPTNVLKRNLVSFYAPQSVTQLIEIIVAKLARFTVCLDGKILSTLTTAKKFILHIVTIFSY
jgi:hypothetical protein